MAEYKAEIRWRRGEETFTDKRYSRAHVWRFDGGVEVPASSSPQVVPAPYSNAAAVDPEEAFVAALSSCHMLWFLHIAAQRGYCIDTYDDHALGVIEKNSSGKLAITRVTLEPKAVFSGSRKPGAEELKAMHHEAHEQCFIANSVKSEVRCNPQSEA